MVSREIASCLPCSSVSDYPSFVAFATPPFCSGGEHQPRIPCDAHLLDISTHAEATSIHIRQQSSPTVSWPSARVGAPLAALGDRAYLWGGRGGPEMVPLSTDDDSPGAEDLWRYSVAQEQWERLSTTGDKPCGRSYHCIAAQPGLAGAADTLWLHSGCPASGRLSSLHSLDLSSLTWRVHPDAPGPGRGGSSIVFTSHPLPRLLRWGGFCGHELGGPLAEYDIAAGTWSEHPCPVIDAADGSVQSEPPARSVYAFHALPLNGLHVRIADQDWVPVAILSHGEGEGAPKELGHAGAGKFLSDTWVLVHRSSGGKGQYAWVAPALQPGGAIPEPRGWFASGILEADRNDEHTLGQLVLHGGLNEANRRLGDAWVLTLVLE